jgi:HEAT repeat protein
MHVSYPFFLAFLIGAQMQDKLLADLASPDDDISAAAAEKLIEQGKKNSAVVPAVAKLLQSPKGEGRYLAASVLGRIGPNAKSTIPAMSTIFFDTKEDRTLRSMCASAISMIGNDGVPVFQKGARADEVFMRRSCIDRLGVLALHNSDLVGDLISALGDRDGDVREIASSAIAELGPKGERQVREALANRNDVVKVLAGELMISMRKDMDNILRDQVAFLEHESSDVRYYAIRSLWNKTLKLKDSDLQSLLKRLEDKEPGNRGMAIKVLATVDLCGADAVTPIVARLKDSSVSVRVDAVQSLQKLGKANAIVVNEFTRLLGDEKNPDVIIEAIEALTAFGPSAKSAAPALRRLQTDSRFRGAIHYALEVIER